MILIAESPGVQVLGENVAPQTSLNLYFNSLFAFDVNFESSDRLVLLPNIFEIAPVDEETPIYFSFSNTDSLIQMSANGTVQLLKLPGQDTWAYEDTTEFDMSAGNWSWVSPDLGPSWLCVPAIGNMRGDVMEASNGRIRLDLNIASGLSLGAENVNIALFGNDPTQFTCTMGQGKFEFQAVPPDTFPIGPFDVTVVDIDTNPLLIKLDFRSAAIALKIPKFTVDTILTSPGNWPKITFPGINLDTGGDFHRRIPLDPCAFRAIALGDNGDDIDVNYVVFERTDGDLRLEVHDEVDFFDSNMGLEFELTRHGLTEADVAGRFWGKVKVDDVNLGDMDLSYDSDRSDYQFHGKASVPGIRWGVYFGTHGAKACYPPCSSCYSSICFP